VFVVVKYFFYGFFALKGVNDIFFMLYYVVGFHPEDPTNTLIVTCVNSNFNDWRFHPVLSLYSGA